MHQSLASLVTAFFIFIFSTLSGLAETKIPFALDWKFEGPSAPYFYSIEAGNFRPTRKIMLLKEKYPFQNIRPINLNKMILRV